MGTIEHKSQGVIDDLAELRDLARTGLPTGGMTGEQWANHRLARIARKLDLIVGQLEQVQTLDSIVRQFENE